ncbi:phage tail protein [Streptomyces sp. NPDC055006]
MTPVTQGIGITTALLPRLTPLVKSASTQLTRLTTVAGGAIASPGFDALTGKFDAFTNRTLKAATDEALHFMRVLSSGSAHGPLSEVMDYVRSSGPAVRETLGNLAETIGHVMEAAAQAGPGMLSIVNGFAQLVSAVPASLLANLMQVYTAFKLIKLAGVGMAAVGGGVNGLVTKLTALRTAAVGAGGGMAGLRAAFATLGTAAKATVIVAGIAAVALVLTKLSSIGKQAPPDVDRLTTSLGNLGRTGKVTGEAAKAFGKDLGGLSDSLRTLARPSNAEGVQQWLTSLIGMDSTPVKDAKEDLDGVDKALANLVKGGKADLAEAAFNHLAASMRKQGMSTGELRKQLGDYKSALADQAFEQQLAAESMGLFGTQAQSVQEKLNAQKSAADGLRQSIQALNDVQRTGLGGMIGFEAAIDAAAKAARENAGALKMSHGELDLNSDKARIAAGALNDLAARTDEAAAQARQSTGSWEQSNKIYARGRSELIKQADAMGLTREQAVQLADSILKIPDKKTRVKMDVEDAKANLSSFINKVRASPGSKSVTMKALTKTAEGVLRDLGFKVTHMKNGSVRITAKNGQALSGIAAVKRARDSLRDKSITLTSYSRFVNVGKAPSPQFGRLPGTAFGGPTMRKYASGGDVQAIPNGGYIQGPGSGTSDSIIAAFGSGAMGKVSNTEFVVQASAVRKYGVPLLDKLNRGSLKLAGFARGGVTKSEAEARKAARGDVTISHFGTRAGYKNTEIRNALAKPESIGPLVSALNQWRSTILKSTHGSQERGLLRMLDSYGKSLIKNERSLAKVNEALDKAKTKLSDLKSAASQLAESVKSGILSSANITKGASGDAPVTTRSIMAGLTASRDKASAFAGALKGLKGKGLSAGLLQQIAEAGIDGGGLETAGALMGASKSEIASMNKLQGQIGTSAKSAGATTSDAVYGAQIKAASALVTTLTKQQTKLEKAMDKLAAAIEKSIKRAIGGKATGGIIGAATGGARGGLTWVGEHGPELTRLPFGSRVYPAHTSRRMAADAAGPSAPIMVVLQLDGQTLARHLVDPLRGEVRRVAGGNVQRALGVGV